MKKLFVVLMLGTLVCSLSLFAQTTAKEYVVQSAVGKVEREVSAGKWEAVTKGMNLAPSTVVNTGLNSSLVLKLGDRPLTIKAMQKGTVEKLTSGLASASSGIRIGVKATDSSVATTVDETRTDISTASTRADDAKKDLQWDDSQN